MEDVKKIISSNLQKAVKELTGLEVIIQLEHPLDEKHGDYSTSIALTLFAKSKVGTPFELAQKVVKILNTKYIIHNTFSKIEAAKPGFINFWLSKDYLITLMIHIIRVKDAYGFSKRLENRRIMVEFTDPNPFKEFHIGHLYSNIVGESICRLLESGGAIVKRANYQGDVGMHVAKSLYAILQISNLKSQSFDKVRIDPGRSRMGQISNLENKSLKERAEFLGKAYALGVKAYEEDENAKKEIEKINKQIYEKDPAVMPMYEKGRAWSLEYFETIYRRLGTKFDYYYFESEAGEIGLNLVNEYLKKEVFQKSKGAVIFNGEKYGLHNRVFINSQDLPTYEAKDLGLAPIKYKDFPYDLSIIITASEQSDYFKVVLKALSKISRVLAEKTKHIAHGVVRLPMGKMSSRTGTVITGEWLLDEVKRKIKQEYKEMDGHTAEKVAVGAVKYALLKSGIGRDIAFSFEKSISLEGNSGPYLQYTYARTQSVLAKVKSQSPIQSGTKFNPRFNRGQNSKVGDELQPEELSILRALHRFPEIVEEASQKFAPNILCNYLFDLSQKFNLFYQKVPILKGVQSELRVREFRVALTMAVGEIIKNGLYLLGIYAPDKM